jgi:hypothetical protein
MSGFSSPTGWFFFCFFLFPVKPHLFPLLFKSSVIFYYLFAFLLFYLPFYYLFNFLLTFCFSTSFLFFCYLFCFLALCLVSCYLFALLINRL